MQSYYVDQNMNTNKLQISSDFISLFIYLYSYMYIFKRSIPFSQLSLASIGSGIYL